MNEHPEAQEYAAAASDLAAVNSELPIPYIIRYEDRHGLLRQRNGFLVPGTEGLLAVDERYPADEEGPATWIVTHLPTGTQIRSFSHDIDADSLERAVRVAQQFYAECRRRGWNLLCTDRTEIDGKHKALSDEEKRAFWRAVNA